jgi:hypothetical protein
MNKAILIVPLVLLMRPGQNTRGSNMEFCSKNDDTTVWKNSELGTLRKTKMLR